MELALDAAGPIIGENGLDLFQSLFSWNLLLMTLTRIRFDRRQLLFESLFWWYLLLMKTVRAKILDDAEFQSLFSWNLLLMTACFFPRCPTDEFQSLFSWNLLLMVNTRIDTSDKYRVSILVFVELALDAQRRNVISMP